MPGSRARIARGEAVGKRRRWLARAIAKSAGGEQCECLIGRGGVGAAGRCHIGLPLTGDQAEHEVVQRRQILRRLPLTQVAAVFQQGDVAPIVQPVFNGLRDAK